MHVLARGFLMGAALALAAGCSSASPDDDAEVGTSDSDLTGTLTPPTHSRDRIGVYHWGPDFSAWPGAPDKLTWGADLVASLGSRTMRMAMSPRDEYGVNNGATTLAAIAEQPAYNNLFLDPRFGTYLLTIYTASDLNNAWSAGYSSAQQTAERGEVAALATHLLQSYPGKKFILLNWEGDNAIASYGTAATAWDGYTSWIKSRVNGVLDARKAVPTSTAHVYSGLEYNAVKRLDTGNACDQNANKCIISYVAPQVTVDFYSYSSWQSLGVDTSTAELGDRVSNDLTTAYNFVLTKRPTLSRAHFMVGEFGAERDVSGECDAAERESQIVTALEGWGVSYGIAWQIIDNPPTSGTYDGFGMFKRDLSTTLSGRTLKNLYSTEAPTVPGATCSTINAGGVVNATTFNATIAPGQIISVFGKSFSKTGNVVWIKQGASFIPIKAGSPNWYESAGQINATLPAAVVVGNAVNVYVTNSYGHDSNGQLINIVP